MDPASAQALRQDGGDARPTVGDEALLRLLEGYRFRICEDAESVTRALAVRRRVYVDGAGYPIPVPDAYDVRSWFLLAEDMSTGEAVGSMRLTPRLGGRLELERSFVLPATLRTPKSVELNRFAILPGYRRGKTFLPVVSLGLFKLVYAFLFSLDSSYMVIASRPERVWTYDWMRFERTGQVAPYGQLDGTLHELLWYDFQRAPTILEGHPFRAFFIELDYPEIILPARRPALGVGVDMINSGRDREVA